MVWMLSVWENWVKRRVFSDKRDTGGKKRIHHRVTENTEKKTRTEKDWRRIFNSYLNKLDFLRVLCASVVNSSLIEC